MEIKTRKIQKMHVDDIGSIIAASSLKEAIDKFNKILINHNFSIYYWHDPFYYYYDKFQLNDDYYLTITTIPTLKNVYQLSVKYYKNNYKPNCSGFGDINTRDWKEVPDPDIIGTTSIQYIASFPSSDIVLACAEIQKDYYGKIMIMPAIERRRK